MLIVVPVAGANQAIRGADGIDPAEVAGRFEERDRALAANRGGEYVLWFEADLYDQLQIAQILAALDALGVAPGRVTLICTSASTPASPTSAGWASSSPASSPACSTSPPP